MNKEVFLSLNNVNFSIGKRKILKDISLSVHKNDKIALVGKNGVGKSTLLKIICGKKIVDEGKLWIGSGISIGILDQKNNQSSELSVSKYLEFKNNDNNEISKPLIERVTENIKLDKNKKVNNLSGGEKRKLALSELLILKPDLLLLDEPTNHLDIQSINWLEHFLNNDFLGSFLIVSHNRDFLKKTTNKVFWMDRGIVRISANGFFNFEEWKDTLIEQEKRELQNQKKHLAEELDWLNKGVKARRKRNLKRKENVYDLKNNYETKNKEFVKSISKIKILNDSRELDEGPNILINFINVSKNFLQKGDKIQILNNFNFKFMRGEKIGIIGKNGSGKSTFLNLASQKIEPDVGSIKIKKKINFSFFDQSGEQFDDKKTIKRNLIPSGGDYIDVGNKKIHICGYLKNFLFDPQDIDKILSALSGGERNRLLLAKILASPKEILILDEPTNDLDIETIDLLIDFINSHKGSALISSHDLDFLKKTCDKFFIFDGTGIIKYSNKPIFKKEKQIIEKKITGKIKKIRPTNLEKVINRLLKKIEKKELEISNLTQSLQSNYSNTDIDRNNDLIDALKKAQIELEFLEKEWIEIEESAIKNA